MNWFKCIGRPKITLVKIMKNDISIKVVTKSVILDKIEWRKEYMWLTLISLMRIHSQPQNFGTKTWLLFQSFAQSVQSYLLYTCADPAVRRLHIWVALLATGSSTLLLWDHWLHKISGCWRRHFPSEIPWMGRATWMCSHTPHLNHASEKGSRKRA